MATSLIGGDAWTRRERLAPSVSDRARSSLRRMRIDLRRSFGFWTVLVTAALAVFFVSRFAATEVVLWPDWSADAARAFIVIGPVFAAWSAMLASRDGKPNRVDLLDSTATPRVGRGLGLAALGMMMALACYGIVAACVLGYASRYATWGGPDWWIVVFGGMMSALFALAGWLLGTFVPGRITPVAAGAGAFLYTVVSYTWGLTSSGVDALQPWRYIEGRWGIAGRMFYDVPPYVGMPHPTGGVLIALSAGAVLIAGYLWAREAIRPALIGVTAGALLLVPGWVLANSSDALPMAPPEPIVNPPMSCGGEVVMVCLHQAYEVQLDDAITFADAFYAPVIGFAGVPEVVTQQPFDQGAEPPGTVPLNAYWTNTPVEEVMSQSLGHALLQGESGRPNASQHAMLTWLTRQAGGEWFIGPVAELDPMTMNTDAYARYGADVDAAAERFAALSADEQRTWFEANWDALRAGELTLADVP